MRGRVNCHCGRPAGQDWAGGSGNLPDRFGRAKMDPQTQRRRDCFGTIVSGHYVRWTGSNHERMRGNADESLGFQAQALAPVLSAACLGYAHQLAASLLNVENSARFLDGLYCCQSE